MYKLLFIILILLCHNAEAENTLNKCLKLEQHEAVTFLLVDRTDKLQDSSSLKQTLATVNEITKSGERLIVGTSAGKLSETHIVFDMVKPTHTIWESTLKIRAKEKLFNECLAEVEKDFLTKSESYPTSAIVETLSFVSNMVFADSVPTKRVIMFSDMLQNSEVLSFINTKSVDTEETLKKIQQEKLLWNFSNVDFFIAGAGIGASDKKAREIESFWRKYFEQAGAKVKFYGPLLLGVN